MNFKKFNALNCRLQQLLKEQEMFMNTERPDWWKWWKLHNLKEPSFEIDNLEEKIKENNLATINVIEELLDLSGAKFDLISNQAELIFK